MRYILNIFLISLSFYISGQAINQEEEWLEKDFNIIRPCNQECIDSLLKYDYSSLWTRTSNDFTYGFIGANYQRLRIIIISAVKNKGNPAIYNIIGKSNVKNNICEFSGTIKISQINVFQKMHLGVDDVYKNKGIIYQGILIADYQFKEDSSQVNSGLFDGTLTSWWYVDKNGKVQYDDIESISDTYNNNQFVGTWTSFRNDLKKVCNWGDWRIPFSGDLDIGVGEFSPDDKYLQYGWQTYRDAYIYNNQQARQIEENQWWK